MIDLSAEYEEEMEKKKEDEEEEEENEEEKETKDKEECVRNSEVSKEQEQPVQLSNCYPTITRLDNVP